MARFWISGNGAIHIQVAPSVFSRRKYVMKPQRTGRVPVIRRLVATFRRFSSAQRAASFRVMVSGQDA